MVLNPHSVFHACNFKFQILRGIECVNWPLCSRIPKSSLPRLTISITLYFYSLKVFKCVPLLLYNSNASLTGDALAQAWFKILTEKFLISSFLSLCTFFLNNQLKMMMRKWHHDWYGEVANKTYRRHKCIDPGCLAL